MQVYLFKNLNDFTALALASYVILFVFAKVCELNVRKGVFVKFF